MQTARSRKLAGAVPHLPAPGCIDLLDDRHRVSLTHDPAYGPRNADLFTALWAFKPEYLTHIDHAVLRRPASCLGVAFTTLMQGAGHAEVSKDLMRQDAAGPKLTMDARWGTSHEDLTGGEFTA
jgi:hypothetical protein